MTDIKIENIEFTNNTFEKVRFSIIDGTSGVSRLAEMKVPENYEKGVNKYWDLILNTISIEELKQNREDKDNIIKDRAKRHKENELDRIEHEELKRLFKNKAIYMKMPFVTNSEQKSLIRKSPNNFCLEAIAYKMMYDYIEKNDIDIEDLFDQIEDVYYEAEQDTI